MPDLETLRRIDAACALVSRATGDADVLGPLTTYRARRGWPLAARPTPDIVGEIGPDDVTVVVAAQRAADVPVSLEWIHETAPTLADASRAAGLVVETRPLLVLGHLRPHPPPDDVAVGMVTTADPAFDAARAAVDAGFRDTDDVSTERSLIAIRERADAGALRVCAAVDHRGPVGGGTSVWSAGDVVELTGIAVLPRARGCGVGAAVTAALAADARQHGARLVWLSATDDRVARVYERLGFVRSGVAMEAALAD